MDFQDYQRAFAARLRAPNEAPRPEGVPARRMRVYEELLYNNLEGFLLACFPVCRRMLGPRRWHRMARAFFREHACRTPYFREIPAEFLAWLETVELEPAGYPAYLPELAHHEWVELLLETAEDTPPPAHVPTGDLLGGVPLLNPIRRLTAYAYPVHRIGPDYRPRKPGATPTFLLAMRSPDFQVRFLAVNALTAGLLDLLGSAPDLTGEAALARLAIDTGRAPDSLREPGRSMLTHLREQGVVLGVREA